MAEYIEREHLARLLTEDIELFGEENSSAKPIAYGTVMGLKTALRYVNGVGAADVVEVRHGHWIEADSTRKGEKFVCSVCKGVSYYPQPTRSKNWVKHCGYSYCPHCIAKMDGKVGAE